MKFFSVLLPVWSMGLSLAAAGSSPKVQFDKTVYDFGETSELRQVHGKFTIVNAGDSMLKLGEPTVTCGCTLATLTANELAPGEKGELSFDLELGNKRATLVKHITVHSNDPVNPAVELTIKANYVPLYELDPTSLRLSLRQGDFTNVTVKLARTDGKDLKIGAIETSKPWITAQAEMLGNETANLSITVKPDGAPRHLAEVLQVFPKGATSPAVSLFITGKVVGDIIVSPELLNWKIGDSEALTKPGAEHLKRRRLTVTSSAAWTALELREPTSSIPGVQVKLERNQSGYDVVATLAEIPRSSVRGTITIESNLPSQPKIIIPVLLSIFQKPGLSSEP